MTEKRLKLFPETASPTETEAPVAEGASQLNNEVPPPTTEPLPQPQVISVPMTVDGEKPVENLVETGETSDAPE